MKKPYYNASQHALSRITEVFDTVWPISVGLWTLRCQIAGIKSQYPEVTETQLASKLALGSGISGTNFHKTLTEIAWDDQKESLAWILLNSLIPIFEGWLEEIKASVFTDMRDKEMQFPTRCANELQRLTADESQLIKNAFYTYFCDNKNYSYGVIDNLLLCFRFFKEMRNCYMHNNLTADQKLINAYSLFLPVADAHALNAAECPEHIPPALGSKVRLSLRGVVGFSDIIIKIIISCDSELIRSKKSEEVFIAHWKEKHSIMRTLKSDQEQSNYQVSQLVTKCGYPKPNNPEDMKLFLLHERLISR